MVLRDIFFGDISRKGIFHGAEKYGGFLCAQDLRFNYQTKMPGLF